MGSVWWVCVVEDVEVASTPAQWFIDILFITRDSRMSINFARNHSQCE